MAALISMVEDVRTSVPSIPNFVATRQLLRAARLFCQETRAWRVDFRVSVTGTVGTVILTAKLPANTELVDLVSIKNTGGGLPLEPRTYSWLDKNITDWRSNEALNATYYVQDGLNTIRLVPTPSTTTADLYDVRVAVKPLRTATTLDDVLVNKYDEVLIHGALGYLCLMPNKPWTDFNLGQYHETQFQSSIPGAQTAATDEFQVAVPRKVKYGGL